jgi:PHD/YefM family antitoxin component YafN of YafNO toxin-antitoxin module
MIRQQYNKKMQETALQVRRNLEQMEKLQEIEKDLIQSV